MTDKEKILAEIERRLQDSLSLKIDSDYYNAQVIAYEELLDFINSLPEEPVSEDFEQALAKEWQSYIDRGAATVDALEDNTQELTFAKGFYRGAKWQKIKLEKLKKLADAMYNAAQYLTTDASRLHKAMEEYHQFVINHYYEED